MQKINLKKGEVLAFKTDTVWGFGCHPKDEDAVIKIYEIKKRDLKKPLILMSHDFKFLEKYIQYIPNYAYELIKKHLPGALTLIFEKSKLCPSYITSSGDTIGVRIPNSEDFKQIVTQIDGSVLATTSCNITGETPVLNYNCAKKNFSNLATIVKPIEDSENKNIPSTVILCEKSNYKILRQGVVEL